jgi:hypothetical protein
MDGQRARFAEERETMDGRRTRFAGEMGGGRFFPTTRKKSIEARKKTINFKCVVFS